MLGRSSRQQAEYWCNLAYMRASSISIHEITEDDPQVPAASCWRGFKQNAIPCFGKVLRCTEQPPPAWIQTIHIGIESQGAGELPWMAQRCTTRLNALKVLCTLIQRESVSN